MKTTLTQKITDKNSNLNFIGFCTNKITGEIIIFDEMKKIVDNETDIEENFYLLNKGQFLDIMLRDLQICSFDKKLKITKSKYGFELIQAITGFHSINTPLYSVFILIPELNKTQNDLDLQFLAEIVKDTILENMSLTNYLLSCKLIQETEDFIAPSKEKKEALEKYNLNFVKFLSKLLKDKDFLVEVKNSLDNLKKSRENFSNLCLNLKD